jgi:hypothetical protein
MWGWIVAAIAIGLLALGAWYVGGALWHMTFRG